MIFENVPMRVCVCDCAESIQLFIFPKLISVKSPILYTVPDKCVNNVSEF